MPNYAERITEEANALAGAVRLANATTGAEDTGIVDAVATLIAGYGGGGGDIPAGMKLQVIEYTPVETEPVKRMSHNLGVVPDFVLCIANGQQPNDGNSYINCTVNYKDKNINSRCFIGTYFGGSIRYSYEANNYSSEYTETSFLTPTYSWGWFLAGGVKYTIFVCAFSN